MKLKIFSILLAIIAGLFIVPITWAQPFEPPVDGGIPQCMANLETCITNLDTCGADLSGCTTDLGTCTSDLSTCSSILGTCNSNLVTCNDELGTCGAEMITCTQNLDQAELELNTCETNLSVCEESSVVFPATGQATCWTQAGVLTACDNEKGEDGYFKAGGSLAYIWNEDGTIVDLNTKLMWERKDMSGGIHDYRTTHRWVQTFRDHIYALNNTCKSDETVDCSAGGDATCADALGEGEVCGFAGYRDWRMPNVRELQSIVDYSQDNPAVSLSFNWLCEEGCSIMGPDWEACSCGRGTYWTSTTVIGNTNMAWHINFSWGGGVRTGLEWPSPDLWIYKYNGERIGARAVRGGL